MKKIYLYLFYSLLLSFLFLFYPFGYIKSYNEEEIAKEEYKIQLKEREVNNIISTLNQKIVNYSIDLFVSTKEPEKEAILALIRSSIKINRFDYIITQAPKEIALDIINKGVKVAPVFFDFGISTLVDMGVSEAKQYTINWLLKNELRVGGGNLPLSYKTYKGEAENVNFPFILVYNPKNNKVEILIYSSQNIYPPESKGGFSNYSIKNSVWNIDDWIEKGDEFLSPFIVNISGEIEKKEENKYIWVENPNIEITFPKDVPDFIFEKPTFLEKQISSLKEKVIAFQRAEEKIKELLKELSYSTKKAGKTAFKETKSFIVRALDNIKVFFSTLSGINPFQASFYNSINTNNPPYDFFARKKAEEILNAIRDLNIYTEEELFNNILEENNPDLDYLLEKLKELQEDVNEMQIKITEEIKEYEEVDNTQETCSVNINTASKEDLQKIIGIGPTYADRIIEERPFSSINDLLRVNGIGEATLVKIIEQNCAFVDNIYYASGYSGTSSNDLSNDIEEETCNVNINTASKEDLQKITGIGPTYADRIIEERPFSSINDLLRVNGIGEATLAKIIEQDCAFIEVIDEEEGNEDNEENEDNNEGEDEEEEDTEELLEQNYYWANLQQNPQKTGEASVVGPANVENPISEVFLAGEGSNDYFYNIVIDTDNNLYFKAKIDDKEGIYSYNQNKEELWFKEGSINSTSHPILTSNGDIFFYTNGGSNLYLYSKEGNIIWEKTLSGYEISFNPLSYNNFIYSFTSVKDGFRNLVAIDVISGEIVWNYEINQGIGTPSQLSVSIDGNIYFGIENFLYSINSSGEERWVKEFKGDYTYSSVDKPSVKTPVSINEREIYLIVHKNEDRGTSSKKGYNHCLFKLDADMGQELLKICNRDLRFENLSISSNGNVYFGAGNYNGIKWSAGIYFLEEDIEKSIVSNLEIQAETIVLDREENIYTIFGNSLLRAYSKEGELKWQYSISPSYRIKYLSIDGNGNIYIAGPKNIHIIRNEEFIEPKIDNIAPFVNFNLENTQDSLSFSVLWEGEDIADEKIDPSGIEGYQLKYSVDNENFIYLLPSEGDEFIDQTEYSFEGVEDETYYFRIRAKDNSGNISDWEVASTTILLTEKETIEDLLIVEVQIEGENIDNDIIKIYNPNDLDIDITDYKLRKRNSSGAESSIRVFPINSIILQKNYFIWANSKDNFADLINANASSTATISKNNSIALINKEDSVVSSLAWGESTDPFVEGDVFNSNPNKNEDLKRIWNEELREYSKIGNNSLDFEIMEEPIPN